MGVIIKQFMVDVINIDRGPNRGVGGVGGEGKCGWRCY